MIYYVVIDTNRFAQPKIFDSRTRVSTRVNHNGVRSFLQEYINKLNLQPISIHETQLPEKRQIVCWYTLPKGTPLIPDDAVDDIGCDLPIEEWWDE